jgi:hypothetical protein
MTGKCGRRGFKVHFRRILNGTDTTHQARSGTIVITVGLVGRWTFGVQPTYASVLETVFDTTLGALRIKTLSKGRRNP